jgi:PAS domain S-box-containing protein
MSETRPNFSQYCTVGEAAEYLGVTPATLRNWDRNGKLKPRRHPQNGYRIYLHEDLEAILRSADRSLSSDAAPASDWSEIRENEHFVQFYETDDFLVDTVGGFIGAALARNESGVVIATPEHCRGIEQSFRDRGVACDDAIREGRLMMLDAAETLSQLMVNGAPSRRRFQEVIGGLIGGLCEDGRRVYAFGEMVALLWADGKCAAALKLEEFWNELGETHRFALCCGYPLKSFTGPGATFDGVCQCHTRVLPAESYSGLNDRYQRLEAVSVLQQKARSLEAEIAHRQQVEQELLRRERELADFFENATEGLHKVGPDGRILWANRAELELLGYEPEEYIGHRIAEFHADADVIHDMLRRLTSGEDLVNEPARLRCKNGAIKDVLISSNACFEDGRFAYSRCFTRDVTEIKQAECDRAMLAAIVESSQDAIISKTLDGVIRSWNAGAERLFGYSPQEAVGRPITLIVPPQKRQEEAAILERLRRGERIEHFETVRVAKEGRLIDISLTISPLRDSRGTLIGASKVARDITDRKRAVSALRESEERFRGMAELLPVGIYTCEAKGGTITYFNAKAAELWGRSPKLGDADERFCGSLELYLPDGAPLRHHECPMATAMHDGQSRRNVEVTVLRPDGSRVTVLVNIDPLRDEHGEIVGAINVFHDITPLKHAESALRDQTDNLQTLLETLPIGVLIAEDPQCRRIYGNPAASQLLRVPLGANLSKSAEPEEQPSHFRVLRQGETVPSLELPIQRAARGEIVQPESVDIEFNDGALVHVLITATPLYDTEGNPRGAIAGILDVSELKRAEFALREADRRKDEFLATLAHELRNPLAPIQSALHALKLSPKEAVRDRMQGIMQRQMQQLVRLDRRPARRVSRISRGNKIELRRQRVPNWRTVGRGGRNSPAADRFRRSFSCRSDFATQRTSRPDGDPQRMSQVFANLFNNSASTPNRAGGLLLSARLHRRSACVIACATTESGSPRARSSLRVRHCSAGRHLLERSRGGLGIGLTLVRQLVELHGGTINAQSEGVGKGSAFTVRLPLAAVSGSPLAPADPAASTGIAQRRILVVDDNRDSVFTLSTLLRVKGNELRSAYDGLEAVEVAAEFRPEIILMDVGMPKLNGYEATRRIRQTPWGKDVFIVALSGWGQAEDLQKSADAGCSAHLTKPVDFDVLEQLLAGATGDGGRQT